MSGGYPKQSQGNTTKVTQTTFSNPTSTIMAAQQENEPEPKETQAMLRRILAAVEPSKHKRPIEILTALILSLATVSSAWCAYQSKVWSSEQNSRINAGLRAGREAALNNLMATQLRAFDASMFIQFVSARASGNKELADFLHARFRGEMKPAVEAWLATEGNGAPAHPSPLHVPEYQQKEATEAARQSEMAERALASGREARGFSDNYILLTVLFATVLFFGGISRSFTSGLIQRLLMGAATVLFMVTLIALYKLPVSHG